MLKKPMINFFTLKPLSNTKKSDYKKSLNLEDPVHEINRRRHK